MLMLFMNSVRAQEEITESYQEEVNVDLLSGLISQLQSRESPGRTWEMWSAACEWPPCRGGTEQVLNSNWSEWPGQGSTVEHCQGATESRGLPISSPGTPGISSSYCFLRLPGHSTPLQSHCPLEQNPYKSRCGSR